MISLGSCEEKDKRGKWKIESHECPSEYTTACLTSLACNPVRQKWSKVENYFACCKTLFACCPLDGRSIHRAKPACNCSRKQTFVPRRSSPIAIATTNRRCRSRDERSMLLVVATASLLSKRKRCRRRQPSWLTTAIVCLFRKLDPSLASSGRSVEDGARTGTDRYRYVAGSRSLLALLVSKIEPPLLLFVSKLKNRRYS